MFPFYISTNDFIKDFVVPPIHKCGLRQNWGSFLEKNDEDHSNQQEMGPPYDK